MTGAKRDWQDHLAALARFDGKQPKGASADLREQRQRQRAVRIAKSGLSQVRSLSTLQSKTNGDGRNCKPLWIVEWR